MMNYEKVISAVIVLLPIYGISVFSKLLLIKNTAAEDGLFSQGNNY
jgi:hypothetical protein